MTFIQIEGTFINPQHIVCNQAYGGRWASRQFGQSERRQGHF